MKNNKTDSILVTGGAGFIGNHLIKKLDGKYKIISYDIKDERDVRSLDMLLQHAKDVNVIVHLAALCIDPESVEKPLEYFITNMVGTLNVLESARKLGIKKVIFASSAAAPTKATPYGLTKYNGEEWCELYSKLYRMKVYSLRIFNVYGEGNNKGVICDCLKQLKIGEKLKIFGDGNQIRDYIHVNDVVKSIKLFIENDYDSGIYEIGTGIKTSVNDIIDTLSEILDKKIKVENLPPRKGDIKCSFSKNPFIKSNISLKEGLKKLVQNI